MLDLLHASSVPGALEALQRNHKLLAALLEEMEDYHTYMVEHYGKPVRPGSTRPMARSDWLRFLTVGVMPQVSDLTGRLPDGPSRGWSTAVTPGEREFQSRITAITSGICPPPPSFTPLRYLSVVLRGSCSCVQWSAPPKAIHAGGEVLKPPAAPGFGGAVGGGDGKGFGAENKTRAEPPVTDGRNGARSRDGNASGAARNPGRSAASGGGVGCGGAPRWGAGLSEQARSRLNHGRVRVKGVMTPFTHLQHVQVRFCMGGWLWGVARAALTAASDLCWGLERPGVQVEEDVEWRRSARLFGP